MCNGNIQQIGGRRGSEGFETVPQQQHEVRPLQTPGFGESGHPRTGRKRHLFMRAAGRLAIDPAGDLEAHGLDFLDSVSKPGRQMHTGDIEIEHETRFRENGIQNRFLNAEISTAAGHTGNDLALHAVSPGVRASGCSAD